MTRAGVFILYALRQVGKPYVYGIENDDVADPTSWDCSELVQIAAGKAGVTVPDGAANQCTFCRTIPVAVARETIGALLFIQDAHAYPGKTNHVGHVAIVIAKGWCVEAKGKAYGVVISPITSRFNAAGKVDALYLPANTEVIEA